MINRPERLDDRDILSDCLEGAKWGSTIYNMAILEAANEPVRSAFLQLHNDELSLHRNIFQMMHQRGYYQVEPAATWSTAQTQTSQVEQSSGLQWTAPESVPPTIYPGSQPGDPYQQR